MRRKRRDVIGRSARRAAREGGSLRERLESFAEALRCAICLDAIQFDVAGAARLVVAVVASRSALRCIVPGTTVIFRVQEL